MQARSLIALAASGQHRTQRARHGGALGRSCPVLEQLGDRLQVDRRDPGAQLRPLSLSTA
jgi:hypothetical protein